MWYKKILLSILISSGLGFVYGQTLEDDKTALIALYNATDGDNWSNNTNWMTNPDVSTWFGVTVEEDRVTKLHLFSNGLSGSIPVELFNLTALKDLLISNNSLGGVIPSEIGGLLALKKLWLSGNNLVGPIPNEIGNLSSLETLYLSGNPIGGSIPSALGSLTNLIDLWLQDCQMTGPIPTTFTQLTSLKQLILYNNPIGGSIPAYLGQLTSLTSLGLGNCNFTGSIPPELGNLVDLSSLILWSNDLEGELPAELGLLTKLSNLYVTNNNLLGNLPPELGSLTQLRFLSLASNQFTGAFPAQISQIPSLISVNLLSNQFNDLPDMRNTPMANSGNLTEFDVSYNQFTFGDLEPNADLITSNLGQGWFGEIQDFYLSYGESMNISVETDGEHNRYQWTLLNEDLTNENSSSLLVENNSLIDQTVFYQLKVTNDLVPGVVLTSSPINIKLESKDRAALVKFYNATNGPNWTIQGNWNTDLPIWTWFGVTYDGRVTGIYSSFNNLKGTIPPEIADLTELESLQLNATELTEIPDEVFGLSKLKRLDLYVGKIAGPIPASIGNLTSLVHVNLANNELTGSIPAELSNLVNLEYLSLSYNHLEGTLPEYFDSMPNLNTILLTGNNFSGTIPKTYGDIPQLNFLFVDQNNLTGSIPAELGSGTEMISLNLASNSLEGVVPAGIGLLPNLMNLRLQNNHFEGSLPIGVKDRPLYRLIINDNEFTELPNFEGSPLATSGNLLDLNISNNKFTFEDLEPNIDFITENTGQKPFGQENTFEVEKGKSKTIEFLVGGSQNIYQWVKDDVEIEGANSNLLTISNAQESDAGVYVLNVTNSLVSGLTIPSEPLTIVIIEPVTPTPDPVTSLEDKIQIDFGMYPNPTSDVLWVPFASSANEQPELKVFDSNGTKMSVKHKFDRQERLIAVDVSDLSSGIYMIKIVSDKGLRVRKFVKN